MVSVPSRGILFPNCRFYYHETKAGNMFPSPLGVSYFQMKIVNITKQLLIIVSVPSRGILFPNW